MKKSKRKNRGIIIGGLFVLLLGSTLNAQEIPQKKTTPLPVQTEQKTGTKSEIKKKTEELEKVKKVQGSKPDLSKAKGARPPYIVRPSGSGMPVGAGKPGGAIKPGRR